MPEGDTLWRTAAALRERVVGEILRDVRPLEFKRLVGRRVAEIRTLGKHLFIEFDAGLALHCHLRMNGIWYVLKPDDALPRPDHEISAWLTFDQWNAIVFSAPVVEIVSGDERVAHLGPDILSPDFDLDAVIKRARASGSLAVGEVLLDQRVCAGIGNIYKCESLWTVGVSPWQPVNKIDDTVLRSVYQTAKRAMTESALGLARPRRMAVHGRARRPCPRCASRIQIKAQGDPPRPTYWCERCQGEAGR